MRQPVVDICMGILRNGKHLPLSRNKPSDIQRIALGKYPVYDIVTGTAFWIVDDVVYGGVIL